VGQEREQVCLVVDVCNLDCRWQQQQQQSVTMMHTADQQLVQQSIQSQSTQYKCHLYK